MDLVLSQQRGKHRRLETQELCPHHSCPSEDSRGLHKARICSQGSVMRNKGDRLSMSSFCTVSKIVINWHSVQFSSVQSLSHIQLFETLGLK